MKKFYQKPRTEIIEIEVESLVATSVSPEIDPQSVADENGGADASSWRSSLWGED